MSWTFQIHMHFQLATIRIQVYWSHTIRNSDVVTNTTSERERERETQNLTNFRTFEIASELDV